MILGVPCLQWFGEVGTEGETPGQTSPGTGPPGLGVRADPGYLLGPENTPEPGAGPHQLRSQGDRRPLSTVLSPSARVSYGWQHPAGASYKHESSECVALHLSSRPFIFTGNWHSAAQRQKVKCMLIIQIFVFFFT